MTTFTVDSENNITAHASKPAGADAYQLFSNQKELASVTADWPVSRLVDAWNSFAGVAPFDDLKPVQKFTNRSVGIKRIYNAVQRLAANPAQPAAHDAPPEEKAKKAPARAKQPATKRTKANAGATREGSKKAAALALMRRKSGATLDEIMKHTGWQAHTVRGFVSILGSKGGLKIASFRDEDKNRRYRVVR